MAALALSAPIDFHLHEGDLITHYATLLNGLPFGVAVAALASFTLIMAMNTAFVASSELIERVAHRYGFHWVIATNRRQSLYRIHIANAIFFSIIILITSGKQETLADMYALGLLASFCINMGALLIYRYFMGTKELIHFYTSRLVTLIMWVIFVSCFIFLAIIKTHGTMLWAGVTGLVLLGGFLVAQKRAPELKEIEKGDSEMEMILYLSESAAQDVHLVFRRSQDTSGQPPEDNVAYITFYSPRAGIPPKLARQPLPLSPGQIEPLPPPGGPAPGGGVRVGRPEYHRSPGVAHVLLVGPHGHRRHDLQHDAPAPSLPQFQVHHELYRTHRRRLQSPQLRSEIMSRWSGRPQKILRIAEWRRLKPAVGGLFQAPDGVAVIQGSCQLIGYSMRGNLPKELGQGMGGREGALTAKPLPSITPYSSKAAKARAAKSRPGSSSRACLSTNAASLVWPSRCKLIPRLA